MASEEKTPQAVSKVLMEKLSRISMTDKQRNEIAAAMEEAMKKSAPTEPLESTPIVEDKVVCKMMLKGYPKVLFDAINKILDPLTVKTKNGYTDFEKTKKYVMTVMIEET